MYIYNYLSLKRHLEKIDEELKITSGFFDKMFLMVQRTRTAIEIQELNQISNN